MILILALFLFFGERDANEIKEEDTAVSTAYKTLNYDNMKAMWLSQYDMESVYTENGKAVLSDKKTLRECALKTGLVFQNFNLFPHFSVLRNITDAPVRVFKTPKAEAEQHAMELLEKMNLAD